MGSFDAPWSELSLIIDCDTDHHKGMDSKRVVTPESRWQGLFLLSWNNYIVNHLPFVSYAIVFILSGNFCRKTESKHGKGFCSVIFAD